MSFTRPVLGVLVYFAILFVGSGLSQLLPWGVPSAQSLRAASPETTAAFGTDDVVTRPVGTFTTEAFDTELVDEVSILMTDRSVAWIVARPIAYYDPGAYMAKEALTQAVVAVLLTVLLALTTSLGLARRMALVGLAGTAAAAATYGQLFNWWGLPFAYAGGASLDLLVTWLLGGLVVGRFVVVGRPR